VDDGEIRLQIHDAPARHRHPKRFADLFGWRISEDGTELIIHDGSVEPDAPLVDMVAQLDGVLPDLHIVSYDEDQNIKDNLTRGMITEVVCRDGSGTVTQTPFHAFIARAKYMRAGNQQGWNARLHLMLELCTRPPTHSKQLVAWCSSDIVFEVDLKLGGAACIADVFATSRLLQLLQQLERVGGDAAVVTQLRTGVELRHHAARSKLFDAVAVVRTPAPDEHAPLLARLLGAGSDLERVLAVLGPGRFNRSNVELWPVARVISEAHANRTWPQELVAIGTQAGEPLALDTRHQPASVVAQTNGGFEEIDDNLLGLLALAVDSSVWNSGST
jgi:hypothetical protein